MRALGFLLMAVTAICLSLVVGFFLKQAGADGVVRFAGSLLCVLVVGSLWKVP